MNLALSKPLFIIGLQKSGTTLLNRLLIEQSDYFYSPFKLEGRDFWGDNPPFSPTEIPCGEIYQRHEGLNGHSASIKDYQESHKNILLDRLDDIEIPAPILINKNPYNTVRIPWLKVMFPQCKIVAMVRDPYANVFSLLKKHFPHEGRGLGPENGWWGVKPLNWNKLVCENKVIQLAKQWREVNKEIVVNFEHLDLVINYKNLCKEPNYYLSSILSLFDKNSEFNLPSLKCMDDEYKKGSQLLSKNRHYQKKQDLSLSKTFIENIELPPFNILNKLAISLRTKHTLYKLNKIQLLVNP